MSALEFKPQPLLELHLASFPDAAIHTSDGEPHVSASQLKMFARCPEQYRMRYILGKKERPNGNLVWGLADHAAHEENFKQKVVSGRDLKTAEVKEAFAAAVDLRVEEDGGPGEVDWGKGEILTGDDAKKALALVKDNGVDLVGLYHETVSPTIMPLGVEEPFTLSAEMLGSNVKLIGRIDLRATVPDSTVNNAFIPGAVEAPTVERVIERKTAGAKKKVLDQPEWITQGRIEQLGGHVIHGSALDVDYHLSLKIGSRRKTSGVVANDPEMLLPSMPEHVILQQVRRLIAGISATYAMYGPDDPWPGAFAGFASPCGYCGFQPACPWWKAEAWVDR